jgi:hypothetical protein
VTLVNPAFLSVSWAMAAFCPVTLGICTGTGDGEGEGDGMGATVGAEKVGTAGAVTCLVDFGLSSPNIPTRTLHPQHRATITPMVMRMGVGGFFTATALHPPAQVARSKLLSGQDRYERPRSPQCERRCPYNEGLTRRKTPHI